MSEYRYQSFNEARLAEAMFASGYTAEAIEAAQVAMRVACKRCGAQPGEPCIWKTGHSAPGGIATPHTGRKA